MRRIDGPTWLPAAKNLIEQGDFAKAEALFTAASEAPGAGVDLLRAWAAFRKKIGDLDGAIGKLEIATSLPNAEMVIAELAGLLIDNGNLGAAELLLNRAVASRLQDPNIYFHLGRLSDHAGAYDQAIRYYRLATRAAPNMLEGRIALARLLTGTGQISEAIAAYNALLRRTPENPLVLRQLCWLHGARREFQLALVTLDRLAALGQDTAEELAQLLLGYLHICDWQQRIQLLGRLRDRLDRGAPCVIDPYALLASLDDPAEHLGMARCIASAFKANISSLASHIKRAPTKRRGPGRLRIGYLCGNFDNHSTSYLMADVLQSHDRTQFQITAYDYSLEDNSAIRKRMKTAFERFVQVGASGPQECAETIRGDQIDILIDLQGYTFGTRSEILSFRPAPVQVNFLGYVGTQGNDWVDYVIADKYVLPLSEQPHWHEHIIHMPNSYYPSGRSRPLPGAVTADRRAAHDLPADGFVYCCFNSTYKITPEMFSLWMSLLRDVQGSVLWLYEANTYVAANLQSEAARQGVAVDRLIFGKPLPFAAHIDRLALADLFLDTMPYGAHTTAVDALWAGLPVLTLTGRSFASRVGASLLHAVGVPELICKTPDMYFALAVELARNPSKLTRLREELSNARLTSPLFDAGLFARDLEKLFRQMAEAHFTD